jgi:phosphoglycerol geranylgeranyltransferase
MTRLDDVARSVGTVAEAGRTAARTLAGLDTNQVPADWRHVTKVDPENAKALPLLFPLYLRHTSAVSVGGSRDVTAENTEDTFAALSAAPVPAFHEPSAARHVTEETYDACHFLAVPEVLNGDAEALVGTLGEGATYVREELGPDLIARKVGWLPEPVRRRLAEFATSWLLSQAVFEAYVIQNPDSAAAREANVTRADLLGPREAAKRALAAERHLESEVIYVEYSGTFGGEEAVALLEAVDGATSWSRVWYGGGLDSRERAEAVLEAGADAVVVGDVFHEVAEDERDVCGRALDELPRDADRATVDEWVAGSVDVAGSAAVRYLETVPSVASPRRRAREYLVATVGARLGLAALADDLAGTDPSEYAARLAERGELPGEEPLSRVVGDAAPALARSLALASLARNGDYGGDPFSTVDLGALGAT